MKNLKDLILLLMVLPLASAVYGQFTLSGEIRPRAEYRHGFQSVADSNQAAAFSIDQRTRINAEYKIEDYEFFVSIQDIRTWGSTKQLNTTDGFLAVHQAWAKAFFNKNWGLKLGRQEIIYDDHRIFGNVEWAQQARSHDAALIQYISEKSKLDIGLAFNQTGPSLVGTDYSLINYRDMQYVWFNHAFSDKINMSLLALNLGNQVDFVNGDGENASNFHYTQTLGTHTKIKSGDFKIDFNGYYQMGSPKVHPVKPLSAYLIGIDVNYDISEKFAVGLGYEMQSGTSQTDTTEAYNERAHSFTPWFGTNHKFNGFMDYFYVGNPHGNVGLQDMFLKLKYKKGTWSFGLDGHLFFSAAEVLDQVELTETGKIKAMPSMLGTELDLTIGTKINKSVSVKAGYSQLFATPTLATLKGTIYSSGPNAGKGRVDQLNNWAYVMVIFKPTFIKKEKE